MRYSLIQPLTTEHICFMNGPKVSFTFVPERVDPSNRNWPWFTSVMIVFPCGVIYLALFIKTLPKGRARLVCGKFSLLIMVRSSTGTINGIYL